MIIAKFIHILGFTVWVGGMFFAHFALRPVVAVTLEPPQRLTLLAGVLGKFFLWVWISIALIFGSGMAMMAGMGKPPMHVMLMFVLGVVMMLIFAHIFFAPFRRLKRAVEAQDWKAGGAAMATIRKMVAIEAQDWKAGGAAMATIRKMVAINLVIGLLTIAIGVLGPLAL